VASPRTEVLNCQKRSALPSQKQKKEAKPTRFPGGVLAEGNGDIMTTLMNLTPHPITLRSLDGTDTVLVPSGTVARVTATSGSLGSVEGVPVPVMGADSFGKVIDLPEPEEGVFLIVSGLVGGAPSIKGRADVLVPGTGPNDGAIRNDKGHIIAVTRLKRV